METDAEMLSDDASNVIFRGASSDEDLRQILALQAVNVEERLSQEEVRDQGFVYVHHDLEVLASMNRAGPHVIACQDGRVVGYALFMSRAFESRIPALGPMFDRLRLVMDQDPSMAAVSWFVMGQVCVARPHRAQGVFDGLYAELRRQQMGRYQAVITEIAVRNTRSIRAHERVGFRSLDRYRDGSGENWDVVIWDWR